MHATRNRVHLDACLEYNTAAHLGACGCGYEVSTTINPTDWNITYNGRAVSLSLSIGNSNFPCKSHYRIRGSRVLWESRMTPQLTALSRAQDTAAKTRKYGIDTMATAKAQPADYVSPPKRPDQPWWRRLLPF